VRDAQVLRNHEIIRSSLRDFPPFSAAACKAPHWKKARSALEIAFTALFVALMVVDDLDFSLGPTNSFQIFKVIRIRFARAFGIRDDDSWDAQSDQ
jgi:hypothetical protein